MGVGDEKQMRRGKRGAGTRGSGAHQGDIRSAGIRGSGGRCVERREETSMMGQKLKWRLWVRTAGGRQRIWVSPYRGWIVVTILIDSLEEIEVIVGEGDDCC